MAAAPSRKNWFAKTPLFKIIVLTKFFLKSLNNMLQAGNVDSYLRNLRHSWSYYYGSYIDVKR